MMMPPGGCLCLSTRTTRAKAEGTTARLPGAGGFGAPRGPGAPLSWDAAVKLAARKAFDEQQHRQRDAYNLATRPWREEGGGDHRPGDPTAGADAAHPTTTTLTGPGGAEDAAARARIRGTPPPPLTPRTPPPRAPPPPTLNPGAGAASTERRPNFDRRGTSMDAAVPRGEPPPRTAATTHLGAGGTRRRGRGAADADGAHPGAPPRRRAAGAVDGGVVPTTPRVPPVARRVAGRPGVVPEPDGVRAGDEEGAPDPDPDPDPDPPRGAGAPRGWRARRNRRPRRVPFPAPRPESEASEASEASKAPRRCSPRGRR